MVWASSESVENAINARKMILIAASPFSRISERGRGRPPVTESRRWVGIDISSCWQRARPVRLARSRKLPLLENTRAAASFETGLDRQYPIRWEHRRPRVGVADVS